MDPNPNQPAHPESDPNETDAYPTWTPPAEDPYASAEPPAGDSRQPSAAAWQQSPDAWQQPPDAWQQSPDAWTPQSGAWPAPPPPPPAYAPWGQRAGSFSGIEDRPVEMTPLRSNRGPGRAVLGYFGVAVLAAVLASAGTFGLLQANGSFNPAPVASNGATAAPPGQTTSVNVGSSGGASDVVAAAARVSPAVVTITTSGSASGNGGIGGFPGGNGGSSGGIGSGVIFNSNGWILTNHHVVADGGTISVALADGRTFPGTVYGTDTLTDLAIVKVNATGLPTAQFGDSSTLRVGELVIAIGDPLGGYPGSVTSGIVSGLNRSVTASGEDLSDLIQTDAAINPGNSGGPLVNAAGQVVGLDTAASSSAEGIGFAIPINLAKPLTEQALAGKQLARPWIGVRFVQLDPATASQNHLAVNEGAWITSNAGDTSGQSGQSGNQGGTSNAAVQPGSPAEKAGLKENDIITAINGAAVDQSHPLIEVVASHAPGDTVTLTVRRGSSTVELKLTLSTRPSSATP